MSFKSVSYLDGEKLYKAYWQDMGGSTMMGGSASYRKLITFAVANGMSNPKTGKPPYVMGIWKAMWRWAIKNQDVAYKMAQEAFFTRGQTLSLETWKEEITSKAKTSWQDENHQRRWEKENAS